MFQVSRTYPPGFISSFGLQETVRLVTQRAREALNVQRETARRALLHWQGELLAATHQDEAVARQNLVRALEINRERHNYNVQMQVRQLEQEAGARNSQRQRELLSRFFEEGNRDLVDQRENLVTEVASAAWTRHEQVYDLRTEQSRQAHHAEDVSQQQHQTIAGLHQHLRQDRTRKHSNIEKCLNNLELLHLLLDQKLIDFGEE